MSKNKESVGLKFVPTLRVEDSAALGIWLLMRIWFWVGFLSLVCIAETLRMLNFSESWVRDEPSMNLYNPVWGPFHFCPVPFCALSKGIRNGVAFIFQGVDSFVGYSLISFFKLYYTRYTKIMIINQCHRTLFFQKHGLFVLA